MNSRETTCAFEILNYMPVILGTADLRNPEESESSSSIMTTGKEADWLLSPDRLPWDDTV